MTSLQLHACNFEFGNELKSPKKKKLNWVRPETISLLANLARDEICLSAEPSQVNVKNVLNKSTETQSVTWAKGQSRGVWGALVNVCYTPLLKNKKKYYGFICIVMYYIIRCYKFRYYIQLNCMGSTKVELKRRKKIILLEI